jgi:hypothetical protein
MHKSACAVSGLGIGIFRAAADAKWAAVNELDVNSSRRPPTIPGDCLSMPKVKQLQSFDRDACLAGCLDTSVRLDLKQISTLDNVGVPSWCPLQKGVYHYDGR